MPVDPNDVHSEKRSGNALVAQAQRSQRTRRWAERRGAIRLGEVPSERSVGDAFRLMLEACEAEMASAWATSAPSITKDGLRRILCEEFLDRIPASAMLRRTLAPSNPPKVEASPSSSISVVVSPSFTASAIWQIVDATPLSSELHGSIVCKGRSLVFSTLSSTLHRNHNRLRSKHTQLFLHQCCGLLPCARVAQRLGLDVFANVDADVSMWKELSVLTERVVEARRKATQHRERAEKGLTRQRRWYWRSVLKSASGRLKLFPVKREDLQPRMEWLRDVLFAFVAFVCAGERSGEMTLPTDILILSLFAPSYLQFLRDQEVIRESKRMVEMIERGADAGLSMTRGAEMLKNELKKVESMSNDEVEVADSASHPLNVAAARRKAQYSASGGAHATEVLRDNLAEDHLKKYQSVAPPLVVHCTRSLNALKEVQLLLKYSPLVDAAIREAGGINVQREIQRSVEVSETNPYASLSTGRQQFRAVEYSTCRLLSGRFCIGEGKGESLVEGIQNASQDAVSNFYLRGGLNPSHASKNTAVGFSETEKEGKQKPEDCRGSDGSSGEPGEGAVRCHAGVHVAPTVVREEQWKF